MTDEGAPAISVVIATHGRRDSLAETLDALAHQTRRDVEVIVVDDDSPDGTADEVERRGLQCIRVSRRGPGRARQVGWQAASGAVVAFTDDDCVPEPDWLEHLVAPIEAGEADVVQGRTMPRPDHEHLRGPWSRTQQVERLNGQYQTCNIAYRRSVLQDLGGFRDSFSGPRTAGEDTDLAWRAVEAGSTAVFADDALVHHAIWPGTFRDTVRGADRRGMVVQVIKFHPDARRLAWRPFVYKPSHLRVAVVWGALVAALLVRRWLPPVAAVVVLAAYLVRTRGDERPPLERARHLAQVLAVDTVETAALLRASLRYRRFLL